MTDTTQHDPVTERMELIQEWIDNADGSTHCHSSVSAAAREQLAAYAPQMHAALATRTGARPAGWRA